MITRKNKCANEKVLLDGIFFASKKEARRYAELRLLERGHVISDLRWQVHFEIIPKQMDPTNKKVLERKCEYIADFVYKDKDGNFVVEDAKGVKTGATYELFVVKRKLMLQMYGIRVKEV